MAESATGTFLHTRRFLSYHGVRFRDRSILIEHDGAVQAVLPAAEDPNDPHTVVSHPGSTYGGFVAPLSVYGETMLEVASAAVRHYKAEGYKRLRYKAVPHIYHRFPSQDDIYALFRLAVRRYRCDLSAVIDLKHRGRIGSRRRRGFARAQKAGLTIATGQHHIPSLWRVLTQNLRERHALKPVHTVDEIRKLVELFPSEVQIVVGERSGDVIAGIVVFDSAMVSHAQYTAASPEGRSVNALDFVFEHAISSAAASGKRFFDFGVSTEQQGSVLNSGLYAFKREFGAGSVVHEFFEIDLACALPSN